MGRCALYCNPHGGRAYRTKEYLESHSEKHDTTWADEFNPKQVPEANWRKGKQFSRYIITIVYMTFFG